MKACANIKTMVSDLRLEEIAHGFEFIKEKYNLLLFKDKAFSQICELIDSIKKQRHSCICGCCNKKMKSMTAGIYLLLL